MKSKGPDYLAILLLISVAGGLALDYHRVVEVRSLPARMALHDSIVRARAEAPYRYRLLAPLLVEGVSRAMWAVSWIGTSR